MHPWPLQAGRPRREALLGEPQPPGACQPQQSPCAPLPLLATVDRIPLTLDWPELRLQKCNTAGGILAGGGQEHPPHWKRIILQPLKKKGHSYTWTMGFHNNSSSTGKITGPSESGVCSFS